MWVLRETHSTQENCWDRGRPARNERAARTRFLANKQTSLFSTGAGNPS